MNRSLCLICMSPERPHRSHRPRNDPQRRFISQHGPKTGGVVCTRALRWPGCALVINADAHAGKLQVRVSDELRKPIKGFNYDDASAFTGDSVAHEVTWNGKSLDELKGQVVRLEFQLHDADLYTFRASSMIGK